MRSRCLALAAFAPLFLCQAIRADEPKPADLPPELSWIPADSAARRSGRAGTAGHSRQPPVTGDCAVGDGAHGSEHAAVPVGQSDQFDRYVNAAVWAAALEESHDLALSMVQHPAGLAVDPVRHGPRSHPAFEAGDERFGRGQQLQGDQTDFRSRQMDGAPRSVD